MSVSGPTLIHISIARRREMIRSRANCPGVPCTLTPTSSTLPLNVERRVRIRSACQRIVSQRPFLQVRRNYEVRCSAKRQCQVRGVRCQTYVVHMLSFDSTIDRSAYGAQCAESGKCSLSIQRHTDTACNLDAGRSGSPSVTHRVRRRRISTDSTALGDD
jgi:hypothetical protein